MKSFSILLLIFVLTVAPVVAQRKQDDQLDRAIAEWQAGNTDKAVAALNEIINKKSKHAGAFLLRGHLRRSVGDTAGALADINKAIQLKPSLGQAYHERATLRLIGKDIKGAIQDLDAAIAKHYRHDPVYALRGQLRRDQGDTKGAIADLDEAIKLNPENPQYYAIRGGLLAVLNETDSALADLNHLLSWYEIDPMKRAADSARAITSAEGNRLTVAIDNATVVPAPGDKEMIPFIANAYAQRGFINSLRNNVEAAMADFTKSIRLDSTSVWVFYGRAQALEKQSDWEAALADVSRAIQLEPMNGNLRIEHGVILIMMGRTNEAQVDFDMLLKADRAQWQKRIDDRLAELRKNQAPQ